MFNTETIMQMFQNYNGNTIIFYLFLASVILLLVKLEEPKKKRLCLLGLLSVLLFYNNFSRDIIYRLTDEGTYYRFIWMLPMLLVIAYMLVQGWFLLKPKRYRVAALALVCLIFAFQGSAYLTKEKVRRSEDAIMMESSVMEACQLIEEKIDQEKPRIAFDINMQLQIRSYHAGIIWGISRPAYMYILQTGYDQNTGKYKKEELVIQAVNSGIQSDPKALDNALKKLKIEYMLIMTDYSMDDYLLQIGYHALGSTSGYTLYGRTKG